MSYGALFKLTEITEAARGFYVALPDVEVFMDDLVVQDDQAEYARQLERGYRERT